MFGVLSFSYNYKEAKKLALSRQSTQKNQAGGDLGEKVVKSKVAATVSINKC